MDTAIYPVHQQPLPEPLRQTLHALLQIVPADMVFCKDRSLYIIPDAGAAHSLHEYKVMLDGADWNRTGYGWSLYPAADVCQGIDEGKLFYNTVFTTQWLVYDNGGVSLPLPLPLRVARTEQQGRETFAFGYRRSLGFRKCAAMLSPEEDAGLSAFMLHQSVELLLRAFIIAVTGREVRTHTLADLMKHTLRYAPALKSFRMPSGDLLPRLPERLEQAYVCGRYSPHFHFAGDALPELSEQVGVLQEQLAAQFHRLMEDYRYDNRILNMPVPVAAKSTL